MVDSVGTTRFGYNADGSLASEDGPWASDTFTITNRLGRRMGFGLQQPSSAWTVTHSYNAGRIASVTSPAGTFSYLYTNSTPGTASAGRLVARLQLPTTPASAYITNTYDSVGRLLSTRLNTSTNVTLNLHEYLYNAAHQRTVGTRTNSSQTAWNGRIGFAYDKAQQLVTAWSTNSAGAQVTNECWGYLYDRALNLNSRTNNAGGSSISTYTVNNLNQVTSGAGQSCSYDTNGNMIARGGPALEYDEENQLVRFTVTSGPRTEFVYDGLGRMRIRNEYTWVSGTNYSLSTQTGYIYDGMRVIQERTSLTTPAVAYTRGVDLSSTLEGAGGIGGMLGRSHGYSAGTWSTHHFYHADGNANITYLVNTSQGHGCSYRYTPYGVLLNSANGTLTATANAYRFSSKEFIANPGLYYYGYRFYEPNLQRWINRDPIGEYGGINLYRFVANNPIYAIDPYGEATFGECLQAALDAVNPMETIHENQQNLEEAFLSEDPLIIAGAVSGAVGDSIMLGLGGRGGAGGAGRTGRAVAQNVNLSAVKEALRKVHEKIGKILRARPKSQISCNPVIRGVCTPDVTEVENA